jgi:NAD(P)H dehydrogenase (quinone)
MRCAWWSGGDLEPFLAAKLSAAEDHEFMDSQSVAASYAAQLVDADAAIACGELAYTSGDLRRLIGRPTTPIADSIATALHALTADHIVST